MNTEKPDFSDVQSKVTSTEDTSKPDFSDVQSTVTSTEQITGDGGGAGSQTYTVKSGDTLSGIAKELYGHGNKWHAIFDANRDILDDPDLIKPGQVLKIPAA